LLANALIASRVLSHMSVEEVVPMREKQIYPITSLNFYPIGQYVQKSISLD
jgi:hypothetical protein